MSLADVITPGAHCSPTTGGNEFFTLTIRRNKKSETLKFSSEFRNEILCEALRHRASFAEASSAMSGIPDPVRFNCSKLHWSGKQVPVVLEVGIDSVNQRNPTTGKVIASYLYKDVDCLVLVSDLTGAFVIQTSGFARCHLFVCNGHERDAMLRKVVDYAWSCTGCVIRIKKDAITVNQFHAFKFGKYGTDDAITSLYEFPVHKRTPRSPEPDKRILCLTESCIVERDIGTYNIITVKPLNEIFALIRSPDNAQLFSIEYVRGQIRHYTSTDRDALLASLMDGVRASGNLDIHVKMTPTQRGYRLDPYYVPVDERVESDHLQFLQTARPNNFNEFVMRFNANCAYSGLLHSTTQDRVFAQNKEKLIQGALLAFVQKEGEQSDISVEHLEQQFQALRRLIASKAGFAMFTSSPAFREFLGIKVVKALQRNNDAVTHAAVDMLCALMQVREIESMCSDVFTNPAFCCSRCTPSTTCVRNS